MSRKSSIKKTILKSLSGKKAENVDSVVEYIETRLQSESKDKKTKASYTIRRTIKDMQAKGILETFTTEQSTFVGLSKEGKQELSEIHLSGQDSLLPHTWDGKWRIVIIDISDKEKKLRDSLRYILKKAHFVCVKNSVWISPYPLEHMLANLKKDLNLGDELIIITTNEIDEASKKAFEEKYGK